MGQQKPDKTKVAIIGLGYVGLPLALEFSKKFQTTGFDISKHRVEELNSFEDSTLEVESSFLEDQIKNFNFRITNSIEEICDCNIFIITVPTPIDASKKPNMLPLFEATKLVGKILKKDDLVIYESTVYPGATEEECVPILEEESKLLFNLDFFCGYSPERINPGDKSHTISQIKKVTSGSNIKTAKKVDELYSSIIDAGTYLVPSIKIAEAAKIIENTQRDLNIALINELSIIFNTMNIDTEEVLRAAETKWNFLSFRPGLVGGHCIGVDPYYLTHKAQLLNYQPEIILAGRKLNDSMGIYVANQLIKSMLLKKIKIDAARVLILGVTFKENCPDIRNTKVVDVIKELEQFNMSIDLYDPWADPQEFSEIYGHNLLTKLSSDKKYDAVLIAVAHKEFKENGVKFIKDLCNKNSIIYDLKYLFPATETDKRL